MFQVSSDLGQDLKSKWHGNIDRVRSASLIHSSGVQVSPCVLFVQLCHASSYSVETHFSIHGRSSSCYASRAPGLRDKARRVDGSVFDGSISECEGLKKREALWEEAEENTLFARPTLRWESEIRSSCRLLFQGQTSTVAIV